MDDMTSEIIEHESSLELLPAIADLYINDRHISSYEHDGIITYTDTITSDDIFPDEILTDLPYPEITNIEIDSIIQNPYNYKEKLNISICFEDDLVIFIDINKGDIIGKKSWVFDIRIKIESYNYDDMYAIIRYIQ